MKAAFTVWQGRIAPVFDVARRLHIVEAGPQGAGPAEEAFFLSEAPALRAQMLLDLGVRDVVCGAISRPAAGVLQAYGLGLHPFTAGPIDEVVQAWLSGGLGAGAFAMPGCPGRGQGWMGGRGRPEQEWTMNRGRGRGGGGRGASRGGRGAGRGGGRGRGGRGRRGMAGPAGPGPGSFCQCLQCGYSEPHQAGLPCLERACPQCGAVLTRG